MHNYSIRVVQQSIHTYIYKSNHSRKYTKSNIYRYYFLLYPALVWSFIFWYSLFAEVQAAGTYSGGCRKCWAWFRRKGNVKSLTAATDAAGAVFPQQHCILYILYILYVHCTVHSVQYVIHVTYICTYTTCKQKRQYKKSTYSRTKFSETLPLPWYYPVRQGLFYTPYIFTLIP